MSRKNRIPNVSTGPTLFIGGGGAGRDLARLTQERYIRGFSDLLGLNDGERGEVSEHLRKLYAGFYVDSDQWDDAVLEPRFAGEEPERLRPPAGFEPLASPSGRYIIEHADTPPFRHFSDWPRLNDVEQKSCDAEAEGNRLYGEANVYVNIREIASQIGLHIEKVRSLAGSDAWQALVAYGVPVTDKSYRVELCISLSGGQGTGAALALLGLVGKQVEDDREKFKINLHVLLPGFFRAQGDEERREQRMKALSVLRDLAALKVSGSPLEIMHPEGIIALTSRHTNELFNHLFVYQPSPAEKNRYESFISRASQSIVNAELSAAASDLRRSRSNALELARRTYSRKKFAVVGA
jgi:hypothetical protein